MTEILEMEGKLCEKVDALTEALEEIVKGEVIPPISKKFEGRLRFIVARRWNSWYPSYFETEGGCYAFITRDREIDPKDNAGIIVIDPGIKFAQNLRKYFNIEPYDIRTVIASHYHPDHVNGLFELLTLTHEASLPCKYYLNRSTYDFFKVFQGKYNKIIELPRDQVIKIADYNKYWFGDERGPELGRNKSIKRDESIYLRTLKTFHEEIGNRHNCLAFQFDVFINNNSKKKKQVQIVVLGDTDGNENYLFTYLDYLKNADIAVLHLGSFSDNGFGCGNKHLYKVGLQNLINCIDCARRDKSDTIDVCPLNYKNKQSCRIWSSNDLYFNKLKLIIVSEMGLEMASYSEMINSFSGFKWASRLYSVFMFIKYCQTKTLLEEKFRKVDITEEKEICAEDKIKLNLYSTLVIDSLKCLDNCSDIEVYNFAVFLGFTSLYISANVYDKTKTINFGDNDEISNNVKICFDKINKMDFSEKIKENWYECLDQENRDLVDCIQNTVEIISNLLKVNVTNDRSRLSERLMLLYLKIDKSIYNFETDIKRNRVEREKWESNFKEYMLYIQALQLYGTPFTSIKGLNKSKPIEKNEGLKTIYGYIGKQFEKFSSSEIGFTNLVQLISIIIKRVLATGNIGNSSMEASNPEENSDHDRSKLLLEILKYYSEKSNNQLKYFIADFGIEIDLEKQEIMDSTNKKWIPIAKATQELNKDGEFIFKNL